MALEFKIGKSAYEALPKDVQKEYKSSGDDYTLDLTGYEDPAELKRARDAEKEAARVAKRERDEANRDKIAAEKKVTELEKAGGDVTAAVAAKETEWKTKYDKDIGERDGKLTGLQKSIIDTRRNEIANDMAKAISTVPSLLAPKIAERIHVELGDDNAVVVKVIGKDGKPSASTLDDLKKETLTNKEFAGVIIGSKGTGGGGAPRANTPPLDPATNKPVDLSKMDPRALADQMKANKEAGAT